MARLSATFTLILVLGFASQAWASDPARTAPTTTPVSDAVARAAAESDPAATNLWTLSQTPRRPALLPAMYAAYAGLQVMDVVSTRRALAAGAREGNPLMKSGNLGTSVAIKAATGVASIYLVERAWKKNRVGAIVLMAAINGASAAVVAHNNRMARR